jgi:hypothetical protein
MGRLFEVHGVDLEVPPVERAVAVIVIRLAFPFWVSDGWIASATRHAGPNF